VKAKTITMIEALAVSWVLVLPEHYARPAIVPDCMLKGHRQKTA